jgi:hypothetical protein
MFQDNIGEKLCHLKKSLRKPQEMKIIVGNFINLNTFKIKMSIHQKIPLKMKTYHRMGKKHLKSIFKSIRLESIVYEEYWQINKRPTTQE